MWLLIGEGRTGSGESTLWRYWLGRLNCIGKGLGRQMNFIGEVASQSHEEKQTGKYYGKSSHLFYWEIIWEIISSFLDI